MVADNLKIIGSLIKQTKYKCGNHMLRIRENNKSKHGLYCYPKYSKNIARLGKSLSCRENYELKEMTGPVNGGGKNLIMERVY